MLNWDKISLSLAFLALPLGWRAERRYQQMPPLELNNELGGNGTIAPGTQIKTLPALSIIVPARNEESNLRQLLPSLSALDYPGQVEVIVVDDNSDDETALVARNHGALLLQLDELPQGWLGKPHACHQGATLANGDWFLFTDADTVHTPDGPAQAVGYVLENSLDGLTSHLQHVANGWLDSSALTTAYAALFAGLPAVNKTLNGQYVLIRRDVYEKSGGFAAVRQESMEDLAMGHQLSSCGFKAPMVRGEAVAKVTMYRSIGHLWRGMVRISSGSLPWSGAGSLITALFITALMTPLFALRLVLLRRVPPRWLYLTWGSAAVGVWPWSKRFGSSWLALFAPLGALFVQVAAVWGLLSRLVGHGIKWKGRTI